MRILFFCLLFSPSIFAQSFQSYYTGDTTDVVTPTQGGVVLMGGATEDDNAMRWFLQRSGGGDIVVIRTSGSDGYNDYLYSQLGVSVNSVETILTSNYISAQDPYVAQHIRNAEALWIAGGDQGKYVNYWKNGPVEDAIRYLIHTKKAVVGGTSAGMAILGEAYFSALNGSVTSAEALANPYNSRMTLGYADFLDHPDLQHVITDTHYDDPDRRGRHVAFLARLTQDYGFRSFGIACEEYTAVCIDTMGWARVYGGYPQDQDYAYFLQADCAPDYAPEICSTGQPLQWIRGQQAVRVFKAEGRSGGQVAFNIRDWQSSMGGGVWQRWWVDNGTLQTGTSEAPNCVTSTSDVGNDESAVRISPNPVRNILQMEIDPALVPAVLQVFDVQGKLYYSQRINSDQTTLNVQEWPTGLYFFRINGSHSSYWRSVLVGQ
jgi:cyanophycinase-like exopeptidase